MDASQTRTFRDVQRSIDADLLDPEGPAEGTDTGPAGRIPAGLSWVVGAQRVVESVRSFRGREPQREATAAPLGLAAPLNIEDLATEIGIRSTELLATAIARAEEHANEAAATAPPKVARVGVLFVHGVGSQPKSETVREFGEPLIDWLEEWHRARKNDGFQVLWSRLSYGEDTEVPATYALRLPAYERDPYPGEDPPQTGARLDASNGDPKVSFPAQTWILTEAWWASRLATPSLGFVLGWAALSYPTVVMDLIRNGVDVLFARRPGGGYEGMSPLGRIIAAINAILVVIGYVLAFLPGLIVIGVLTLVSKLPVPGLDQFVLSRVLQPLLVNNLGDHVVFMRDEVQAAHIRQSVYDAVRWLVRDLECERVVIAAHSQGTVVAFDALSTESIGRLRDRAEIKKDLEKVKTLMTFGSPLNRSWRWMDGRRRPEVRRFANDLPAGPRWIDLYAEFDWAPIGELSRGRAEKIPVTNNLSAISDHGSYFTNYEEFVSRLAGEIDSEAGRRSSRFWSESPKSNELNRQKVLHRQRRVVVWASMRLATWLTFVWVMHSRYIAGAHDLQLDAAALWSFLVELPALGSLPTFVAIVGGFVGAVVGIVPPVAALTEWVRTVLVPYALTGGVFGGGLFLTYLLALGPLFSGWHEAHGMATARPSPTTWDFWAAVRRFAIFALLLGLAWQVAMLVPPLADVTALLTASKD